MAVASVCVSDSCHARTPPRLGQRGRRAVERERRRAAASSRTTSTSRNGNAPSPTPSAFIVASLAPKRAARLGTGSCCPYAYSCSPSVKRRSGERGAPLQREPEPLDLDQVGPEPDPERHGPAFSASGRRGRRPAR